MQLDELPWIWCKGQWVHCQEIREKDRVKKIKYLKSWTNEQVKIWGKIPVQQYHTRSWRQLKNENKDRGNRW